MAKLNYTELLKCKTACEWAIMNADKQEQRTMFRRLLMIIETRIWLYPSANTFK